MSRFRHLKAWASAGVALFGFAAAVDFFWTQVVINGSATSEASRIHHLITEAGVEIPIFGASKARSNYIPEILGADVFNYGMDSASMDVVNTLLQIECRKNKRTPIIVDMSPTAFRGIGDPSKFAPFAYQPDIRQTLDQLDLMEWRYWVPGLRYFGYYDWFLKDYLSEHIAVTKKTVRGYTSSFNEARFDRRHLEEAIGKRIKAGNGFRSYADQDTHLFELIRKTPHRTFMLVYSPLHSSCFANFKDLEGFKRYLEVLRGFPNVAIVDWSQMQFPDEFFKDTTHLNAEGAAEFSRRFSKELEIVRLSTGNAHQSENNPK